MAGQGQVADPNEHAPAGHAGAAAAVHLSRVLQVLLALRYPGGLLLQQAGGLSLLERLMQVGALVLLPAGCHRKISGYAGLDILWRCLHFACKSCAMMHAHSKGLQPTHWRTR